MHYRIVTISLLDWNKRVEVAMPLITRQRRYRDQAREAILSDGCVDIPSGPLVHPNSRRSTMFVVNRRSFLMKSR